MTVIRVRRDRKHRIEAARHDGPKGWLSVIWYLRPRKPVVLLAAAFGYVLIAGWPSVLWEYEYRDVYGQKYMVACRYWNPGEGLHWRPARMDKCPFIIGGRNADQD